MVAFYSDSLKPGVVASFEFFTEKLLSCVFFLSYLGLLMCIICYLCGISNRQLCLNCTYLKWPHVARNCTSRVFSASFQQYELHLNSIYSCDWCMFSYQPPFRRSFIVLNIFELVSQKSIKKNASFTCTKLFQCVYNYLLQTV